MIKTIHVTSNKMSWSESLHRIDYVLKLFVIVIVVTIIWILRSKLSMLHICTLKSDGLS